MRVFSRIGFCRAGEHDQDQAEHVESSQHCYEQGESKQPVVLPVERQSEDGILAEEATERPNPCQCQRAGDEGPKSDRHPFSQPTHFPNILLVMQRDDDRARAQEQQRFKEGMCAKMKHCLSRTVKADAHDHVAELGDGRVRQNALDVVLLNGNDRRQ